MVNFDRDHALRIRQQGLSQRATPRPDFKHLLGMTQVGRVHDNIEDVRIRKKILPQALLRPVRGLRRHRLRTSGGAGR